MEHPSLSRLSFSFLLALSALGGAARLDGQIAASTVQNPTFTFDTPGVKQVTLQACNAAGCTSITRTITVLDPTPVIDSELVGPLIVKAGRLVRLSGAGHGQPPLTYNWQVAAGAAVLGDTMVAQPTGATAWWDTAGREPGTYAVALDLKNGVGTKTSAAPVLVTVLPETGADFYTVTPCRVLDTRNPGAGGAIVAGTARTIDVAASGCGIPASAEAISANVTVVFPTGAGHVSVYPGNYPMPATSTVNFRAGQIRANGVILPLASDGSGTLTAETAIAGGGSVNLLVDVNGYFL